MTETVVQCKTRPRSRVSIKLSGGRFFTIPESESYSFSVGKKLSDEEIKRLSRMDQYVRGKDKVLRLLALRSRTKWELREALRKLELEDGVVNGIMSEAAEAGMIDDLRFAREYVQAKTELKNLGPHRMNYDLKRLGVADALIAQVLDESFSSDFQEDLAWRAVRRKLGGGLIDRRGVKRVSDYLKRKGFDFEVVNKVTFELLKRVPAGGRTGDDQF
jgi:regulatory protein